MKNLASAQRAVMLEVSYVQKQHSKVLGYAIATEADVINAIRPAMLKHGIVVAPVKIEGLDSGRWEGKNPGQVVSMIRLVVTYRFTHVDSGEFQDVQVVGESHSYGDKACAAAITIAQKYSLLEFFLLERGTDPELVHEHRGERNEQEWTKAVQAIDRVASENLLNNVLENIRTKAREHFSDEDLDELVMYGERRRRQIRNSEAKA